MDPTEMQAVEAWMTEYVDSSYAHANNISAYECPAKYADVSLSWLIVLVRAPIASSNIKAAAFFAMQQLRESFHATKTPRVVVPVSAV
jgi:hypothetical protein